MASTNQKIVIDPIGMNIVNRIAKGSSSRGDLVFEGGVIIEGSVVGNLNIMNGPLVLMQGATIAGTVNCGGDAYLFGTIERQANGERSKMVSDGTIYLASTLVAISDFEAVSFSHYQGAQFDAQFLTRKASTVVQPDTSTTE